VVEPAVWFGSPTEEARRRLPEWSAEHCGSAADLRRWRGSVSCIRLFDGAAERANGTRSQALVEVERLLHALERWVLTGVGPVAPINAPSPC
jgi:hypothetical protein